MVKKASHLSDFTFQSKKWEAVHDDGAFSISMDDNEEKNLREICDCLLCMQERKGWGAKVIDRIFRDLTDTFPT